MPILIVLAVVLGFLLFGHAHTEQLPPGVTAGWPIDPRNSETNCGIGIHYEDTFALTDVQLDTARRYVAHACWGAPADGTTLDTGHTYYHHTPGAEPPPTNAECDQISANAEARDACTRLQDPATWYSGRFPPVPTD